MRCVNNKIKISVIIPTYKPGLYLWDCLDSLVRQTLSKDLFEIVLVLNGCNEPYNAEILRFIDKNQSLNFNYIQTEKGGVSNARNLAIDSMQGEYFMCIDDDDYLSDDCLREMYEKISEDVIVECYPYAFNDMEPNIQIPYHITDAFDYCVKHGCDTINSKARKMLSGPCMKLVPSRFIGNNRFSEKFKLGEDSLFMFSISKNIKKIVFSSKNAIYYRRIRIGSAGNSNYSKKYLICNNLSLMYEYSRVFFRGHYSPYFYLSRVMASLISIIKLSFQR